MIDRKASENSVGDGNAPDLQKLVKKYGSYAAIPALAWARYDDQMVAAQHRLARLHKRQSAKP